MSFRNFYGHSSKCLSSTTIFSKKTTFLFYISFYLILSCSGEILHDDSSNSQKNDKIPQPSSPPPYPIISANENQDAPVQQIIVENPNLPNPASHISSDNIAPAENNPNAKSTSETTDTPVQKPVGHPVEEPNQHDSQQKNKDMYLEEPPSVEKGNNAPEKHIQHKKDHHHSNEKFPLSEMELSEEEYQKLHEHHELFDGSPQIYDQDTGESYDRDALVDEWAEHMDGLIPDMLVTFKLPTRGEEYFYQDVGPEPTLLRGGYFVAGYNNTGSIKFLIVDSDGEIIFKNSKTESLFHLNTTKAGTYTFALTNHHWIGEKFVTFILSVGTETTLRVEHVNSFNENVMTVARMVKDIHSESQYLWMRHKGQLASVELSLSRIFWLSLFELLAIIGMVAFQVRFLKNLVANKRLF